jgi:hypothetical protein
MLFKRGGPALLSKTGILPTAKSERRAPRIVQKVQNYLDNCNYVKAVNQLR